MKITLKRFVLGVTSASLLTIYGCGGGGSSTPAPTTVDVPVTVVEPISTPVPTAATTLSGTAAVGAPISGSVFAIDINGKISPAAATSALGAFIVNVEGMTAPFILSITGTAGGKPVSLNSIATAVGQTVNITPLTDLIVSIASGRPGGNSLTTLCAPVANVVPADCLSALASAATPATLTSATQAVIDMIAPLNPMGTNPLTGAFTANGTGMDAVLDQLLVAPAESQGAMATITLIATNNTLGTVTLPATAGQSATTAASVPSSAELIKATAGASVLPEIRACLASLSALYPSSGFVVPSRAAVTPFVDSTFSLGAAATQSDALDALTSTSDMAVPGLSIEAVGLSRYEMSPLSSEEIATLTSATSTSITRVADFLANRVTSGASPISFTSNIPSSAWIQLRITGDAGVNHWKMVKTTDTSGCPGGWKLAGSGHVDMHMNARISRSIDNAGAATFRREWAFHIQKDEVKAQGSTINKIDVRGPGLTTVGDFSNGVTTGVKLQMLMPTTGHTAMRFDDSTGTGTGSSFYGDAEALQSCQDLIGSSAGINTPCIDESKAGPGKVYVWTLKAAGVPVIAFPFAVNAVPLSKAFAQANQSSLFATLTSVTPSGLSGIAALTGSLDGKVTYNYTQSATYGSKMDNCGLYLWNVGTPVLSAEQNAVGHESSCTFTTTGLNSLASAVTNGNGQPLLQITGPLTNGYIGVTTSVLGNQTSSSQPYPN